MDAAADNVTQLRPVDSRTAMPANDEAEMALLGALLVYQGRAYERVRGFLRPEHFHSRVHERVYTAIATLCDAGRAADPISLKGYFADDPVLSTIEGGARGFLVHLAGSNASLVNVESYGRTIRDLAVRRSLIAFGEDVARRAQRDKIDDTGDAQVVAAEAAIAELMVDSQEAEAVVGAGAAAQLALEDVDRAMRRGTLVGLPTGLATLDQQTGGLQESDLIVVAGRPGMGKTGLLGTIALAAARAEAAGPGRGILVFSLEMSTSQLGQRLLAALTGIPADRQRKGRLTDAEFDQLAAARGTLETLPLFIDGTAGATLGHMRARARRQRRASGLAMILVDHMQIVRPERRSDNRVADMTEISGGLKNMAKDFHVPVVALSQLSRAVEARDDKRPRLSDLRESGSIEQDADSVWFCYRASYYDKQPIKTPGMSPADYADALAEWKTRDRSTAEIIAAKERHSGPFTLDCVFDGPRTLWQDPPEAEAGQGGFDGL